MSIGRTAITSDELDTGMIVEPLLDGFGIAVGQEIDHVAPLKVHGGGCVTAAFERGRGIDPNEAERRRGFTLEPLDAPEQRVWAGGDRQEIGEAGAGFASESKPDRTVGLAEAVGCTSVRMNKPCKALCEDTARAFGLWAKETSNGEMQPDGHAEAGQVSEAAVITAVNALGIRAADGARSGRRASPKKDRDGVGVD